MAPLFVGDCFNDARIVKRRVPEKGNKSGKKIVEACAPDVVLCGFLSYRAYNTGARRSEIQAKGDKHVLHEMRRETSSGCKVLHELRKASSGCCACVGDHALEGRRIGGCAREGHRASRRASCRVGSVIRKGRRIGRFVREGCCVRCRTCEGRRANGYVCEGCRARSFVRGNRCARSRACEGRCGCGCGRSSGRRQARRVASRPFVRRLLARKRRFCGWA